MSASAPTTPRAFAAEILDASEARRQVILDRCPAEWHDLVMSHVRTVEDRRNTNVARQEKFRPRAKPSAPNTTSYEEHHQVRGNPAVAAAHLAAARASLNPNRATIQ